MIFLPSKPAPFRLVTMLGRTSGNMRANGLRALLATSVLLGSSPVRAETEVSLRLLRTEPETAEWLRGKFGDASLDSAKLAAGIEKLVGEGRVKELSAFDQKFDGDHGSFDLKNPIGQMEVADGERMPLGTEAQMNVANQGPLTDLAIVYENKTRAKPDRIDAEEAVVRAVLRRGRWELLHAWGSETHDDLLLGLVSGSPGGGEPTDPQETIREVHVAAELRGIDKADLDKFGRSTPATRGKALRWLRDRSPLLASAFCRVLPSERSVHKDTMQWIHERGGEWDTAELGFQLDSDAVAGPRGRLVDLRIEGSWQPRDAGRPPQEPECEYAWADTLATGETRIIEPVKAAATGRRPVLLLTAVVVTVRERSQTPASQPLPEDGRTVLRRYAVHPSLPRKLGRGAPGADRTPFKQLLEKKGIAFPKRTMAMFDFGAGEVVMVHNREAHEKLMHLIDDLDARPPDGGK